MIRTGFIWRRVGTQGWFILTYFYKRRGDRGAERLLASQALCYMQSVLKSIRTAALCLSSINGLSEAMYSSFVIWMKLQIPWISLALQCGEYASQTFAGDHCHLTEHVHVKMIHERYEML
jgi:hypothetical protein